MCAGVKAALAQGASTAAKPSDLRVGISFGVSAVNAVKKAPSFATRTLLGLNDDLVTVKDTA